MIGYPLAEAAPVFLLLLLAACGGSDPSESAPTSVPEAADPLEPVDSADTGQAATGDCTGFIDADGDGFGDPERPTTDCSDPQRVDDGTDCDDGSVAILSELDDADCDGSRTGVDCDDTDPTIHPGAPQQLFVDADCDGVVDHHIDGADYRFEALDPTFISEMRPVGDIDGDGRLDLGFLVQTPDMAGRIYVLYGTNLPAPPDTVDVVARADVTLDLDHWDFSGSLLAAELTGDDHTDLVFASSYHHKVYVFDGALVSSGFAAFDLEDAVHVMEDATSGGPYNRFGESVRSLGDLDGDGLDELAIGNRRGPESGLPGRVHVWLGSQWDAPTHDVSEAATLLTGPQANDRAGEVVASAGDVDGDGVDDLLVGAPGAQGRRGRTYVVSGAELLAGEEQSLDDALAVLTGDGLPTHSQHGGALAGAGDVDGDGLADVVIGPLRVDPYFSYLPTQARLVLGSSLGSGEGALASLGVPVPNPRDTLNAGTVVAAGDLDADGLGDLVIGAPGDYGGPSEVHIVRGSDLAGLLSTSPSISLYISAEAGTSLGSHLSSGADLDGDGRDDLFIGSEANVAWVALSNL